MAIVTTDNQNYSDIADAIREKNGSSETYAPDEMAGAIKALDTGGIKLVSIAITTPPSKTVYTAGETFSVAGMVVTATYSNGATASATGYNFTPNTALEDGVTSVTIQYTEGGVTCTAEQAITVIHRLESIAVTTAPDTTTYEYGDSFSKSGMVVKATYSDGNVSIVSGYTCSPSSFSTIGGQNVTISYTERGITKTTLTPVTVERKSLTAVPSQKNTLTYSGSALTPTWNNYDSSQLTISGETSATTAGTHYATFTPTANYRWSDGTTTGKQVAWTIGKASGYSSISPTSLTLNGSAKTGSITVTRYGTGAITATSSNTDIATVSVSGNVVTVSSVNDTTGSATITIKVAADSNYTAPANKTCAVTASFKPTANTSATSGVSYTNGLSGLDPATLTLFAEAISNNSAITKTTSTVYIDFGTSSRKLSVGDTISWAVNGTSYVFVIVGFNHDDLSTTTAYGSATATGKAGISWQMQNCLATKYSMNGSNTNSGGWGSCALRSTLQSTIKGQLPSAVQSAIKVVKKKASAGSKSTTINTYDDTLFLLSEVEIFGSTNYSASGEGDQYAYYKAGNSKVKTVSGSADSWWERSPYASNSASFCFVGSSGSANYISASYSFGVAFGFCF